MSAANRAVTPTPAPRSGDVGWTEGPVPHASTRRAEAAHDPRPQLFGRVSEYVEGVIDQELQRLSRRRALSPVDVDCVAQAMRGTAEALVLGPLRAAPLEHAEALSALFAPDPHAIPRRTVRSATER